MRASRPSGKRALGATWILVAAPALLLAALVLRREPRPAWGLAAVLGTGLGSLGAWLAWSRLGHARERGADRRGRGSDSGG